MARERKWGLTTDKQVRFVEEYLVDLNATQAAIRAGYSKKTAGRIGQENLQKPDILAAISKLQDEVSAETGITRERVLQEYAKMAFAEMGEYSTWGDEDFALIGSSDLSPDQRAAVQEVTRRVGAAGDETIKIKLHDKKGALDSIARVLGMFVDKKEISGPEGGPIKMTWLDIMKAAGEDDDD